MNFGTIMNSVTKKCVALMVEGEGSRAKTQARDFIRFVHLKEVLERQFRVYHQLNSSYIKDKESAKLFVNETLSMVDGFTFEDILTYNSFVETKFDVPRAKSTPIDIDISKLIKYRTTNDRRNQEEFVAALERVVEHVNTPRSETNPLSALDEASANGELKFLKPKHVVRIALKRFNDKFSSTFDAEDRKVFNILREGNSGKIEQLYSDIYTDLLKEFKAFEVGHDRDLAEKLNAALVEVGSKLTQENLLNAYELRSELRRLREES